MWLDEEGNPFMGATKMEFIEEYCKIHGLIGGDRLPIKPWMKMPFAALQTNLILFRLRLPIKCMGSITMDY
jgi:hypothetical protein